MTDAPQTKTKTYVIVNGIGILIGRNRKGTLIVHPFEQNCGMVNFNAFQSTEQHVNPNEGRATGTATYTQLAYAPFTRTVDVLHFGQPREFGPNGRVIGGIGVNEE